MAPGIFKLYLEKDLTKENSKGYDRKGGVMGYIIGSFNTHEFGNNRISHDIDIMANIIFEEGFDIVALQEVYSQVEIDSLKNRLHGWEGCHGNPGYYLGFGYLWNTKRIKVIEQKDIYSVDKPAIMLKQYGMNRGPYYARFTPRGSLEDKLEIRLLNIHLPYNKGNKSQAKRECNLVTRQIYSHIGYGNGIYTIILGDYNLLWSDCPQNTFVITTQQEKTTISLEKNGFANDFDHFSYDLKDIHDRNRDRVTAIIERVNSVSKYCRNNFEEHFGKVSDHVPIKLELELN
jgi:endonuclease/exonuclease/phosphatase family metal-dependent hydrolase